MNLKTIIKVKGRLDKNWEDYFDGLQISEEEGYTILSGTLADSSQMYGILNRLRDLNLKLVSISTEKNNYKL